MQAEAGFGEEGVRTRLRRRLAHGLRHLFVAGGWLFFAWLGAVIGCGRWGGWERAASFGLSAAAAWMGWHLNWRIGRRFFDAELGRLLGQVEDAPAWALFPQPAQVLKRVHYARFRRAWGMTPGTSGWERLPRGVWREALGMAGYLALCVHPWWFWW